MIKLIVVEDEPLMNKFIVNSINWKEMGIELCGTFFNGQAAFEYIKDNAVDVVLSDIEMPIMDGLTLLEKTVSEYPEVKFIFLTNFDDFKMAKQAFRYGALDYILKTDFSQETFQEIFSELAQKIKPVHNNQMTDYVIKEYALKEYFWNGKIGQWNLKNLRIDVESRHAIAVIRISNYKDIFDTQCNAESANIKPELSDCINEILDSYKNGEFFFSNYNEIIFYFSVSSSGDIAFDYKGLFNKIIEMLNTRFNLKLLAGIYDRNEPCSIKEQYYQVEKSFRYSLILGANKLLSTKEIFGYDEVFNVREYVNKLKALVKSFDFKELCDELQKIAEFRPSIQCIDDYRKLYFVLIWDIRELFDVFSIDSSEQQLFYIDISYCSAEELNVLIAEATNYFMERAMPLDITVMRIQNYICEHFAENVTLQLLAEKFSYDYAGLSRRFQKVTGTTFPKFLNEIRLNEAMKLIQTTERTISDIAAAVGYNNYESFSRNFKQKFKMWPNKARKERNGQ